MPGRANQMSPTDAYNMGGSRWNVPLGVLTNKKALDAAFQQHIWEQQKQATTLASGEKIAGMRSKTAEDVAGIRGSGSKNSPEAQARAAAIQYAQLNLDLSNPDDQAKFQEIYQMFLEQFTGASGGSPEGAGALAAGAPPMTAGIDMGTSTGTAPVLPKPTQPGRAPQSSPAETTATNPKTGKKMAYRNGSWQPL